MWSGSLVPSLVRPIPLKPEPVCNKSHFANLFYLYWYFFNLLNLIWHTEKNFCFYAEVNFWDFVRNDNSNKGTTARLNETRFGPKENRPQYISAQKISTLFDEIARSFSDARAFMAVPVSYYTYEFWLSLCKIVRNSVILLLPLCLPEGASWYRNRI
jgi:hypothetical protein